MSKTKVLLYEGIPITFGIGEKLWVNATNIAKNVGKRTADWLNSPSTKEYIKYYCDTTHTVSTDLVRVIKGGDSSLQGTWIMEDLIINYGQWISPKFAVWVSAAIKELITEGTVSIAIPKDYPSALRALADSHEARMIAEAAAEENKEKAEGFELLIEKADNYTLQEAADLLGTGRTRFSNWLKQTGHLQDDRIPYQTSIRNGWFVIKERIKNGVVFHAPMITPKGMEYFTRIRNKGGMNHFLNKVVKTLDTNIIK